MQIKRFVREYTIRDSPELLSDKINSLPKWNLINAELLNEINLISSLGTAATKEGNFSRVGLGLRQEISTVFRCGNTRELIMKLLINSNTL